MVTIRVNAGTTLTGGAMEGCCGGEGEAKEALGGSDVRDREHCTMVGGGDSRKSKVSTLMGVRKDESTMGRGGLVEDVQPPSTVNYSCEALLCSGESLAELRGRGDGRVRGGA